MKLLFVHLSDMHVRGKESVSIPHIEKIVEAVNAIGSFDEAVIIMSGDCAFSGNCEEYKNVEHIVGNIISKMKKRYSLDRINVLVVPGNHDMDYSKGSLSIQDLNDIYKTSTYEKEFTLESDKLYHFFNFAKRNNCFKSNSFYDYRILTFDGFSIQFDLINSAMFSIKAGEDKGLHYLPQYAISDIDKSNSTDLSVVVMHHAPEWFCDDVKHKLEKIIMRKSSIAFYGHEHHLDYKQSQHNTYDSLLILNGGSLCNGDDWSNSSLFCGILDTVDCSYKNWELVWESKNDFYRTKELSTTKLTIKPGPRTYDCKAEFLESFYEDKKHITQKNMLDRFIFPRLNADGEKDILEFSDFEKLFEKYNRIFILGNYNSGRTMLLKYLFKNIKQFAYPLYIDANDISGSKIDKIIKNTFEETYGDDDALYVKFTQTKKESKLLIFDNVDAIDPRQLERIFSKIDEVFGFCILSAKEFIEFNVYERMKEELSKSEQTLKLTLAPWFSDKRKQLIKKIVEAENSFSGNVEIISNELNQSLKSQQVFLNLNPDFITQFVEYYCKNISQIQNNDSSVFGKVFEANLISSIKNHISGRITVDKVFTILAKISYITHKHKKYPIDESDIIQVIDAYNRDYGDNVSAIDIINIAVKSSVLVKVYSENKYRFSNKSYLSYFVAKELNKKYNDDRDQTDIEAILNYCCFGINSDILLFLIYVTDNSRILDLILERTIAFTGEWEEFKFPCHEIKYLNSDMSPYDVDTISDEEISRIEKASIEDEKAIVQNELIQTVDIYDYSEDEASNLLNQLIRAINLLSIVSKCLPFFEHNMKKEQKDAFVDQIYSLPNKIFYLWALNVEKSKEGIVKFIEKSLPSDYRKQKGIKSDKEFHQDALKILINNSITLLLDIYNHSVIHSTKENTIAYLSDFNFQSEETYSIQHLMMLSNRNKVSDFISEAERIIKKDKGKLPTVLVKFVTNHALYSMKGLTRTNKESLLQKVFPEKKSQKALILSAKRKETQND